MAAKAAADGQPPRAAARAALGLLGWPTRRLALGEHRATAKRFLRGERDLPGVEAWLDLVSAPLRWHPQAGAPGPGPDVSARDVPEPAMDGAGLREAREAMR